MHVMRRKHICKKKSDGSVAEGKKRKTEVKMDGLSRPASSQTRQIGDYRVKGHKSGLSRHDRSNTSSSHKNGKRC